jgi:hypothetical protein
VKNYELILIEKLPQPNSNVSGLWILSLLSSLEGLRVLKESGE